MVYNLTSKGLLAAFAASALALVAAFLLSSSIASANPGAISLSAESTTVEAGSQVTVSVDVTPDSGETVAGISVDVAYDPAVLTFSSCAPSSVCNPESPTTQNAVALAPTNLSGLGAGAASVTFDVADDADGETTVDLIVNECVDDLASPITCTAADLTLTVGVEETEAPTDEPTEAATTPAELPDTGGLISDGSGDSTGTLTWVLAAAGLAIVAGGAWAVARARREI